MPQKNKKEILHHLGCIKLIVNGINWQSTGAGFLPWTVRQFQGGYIGDIKIMKLSQTLKTLGFFPGWWYGYVWVAFGPWCWYWCQVQLGLPNAHESSPAWGGGPQHMPPARNTPWKINGWFTYSHHPFRKENDLPNLHDYVPAVNLPGCKALSRDELLTTIIALFRALSMALIFLGWGLALGEAPSIHMTNPQVWQNNGRRCMARWWFQRFFIFTPTWGRFPCWLIFFNWVETTKEMVVWVTSQNWRECF